MVSEADTGLVKWPYWVLLYEPVEHVLPPSGCTVWLLSMLEITTEYRPLRHCLHRLAQASMQP